MNARMDFSEATYRSNDQHMKQRSRIYLEGK